jgi:catechol 2,3-dioxygenase-like lactoylglutathione lyase family enzyme
MAKIKHLALITLDPEALAKFYCEVFDMEIVERGNIAGEVYITDGYLTVALLSQRAEGKPNGLNHFGFHIEDQEEMAKRLTDYGMASPAKRPADRPYAETRATDPDGNNFDLSVHGFQRTELQVDRDAKVKDRKTVDA